MSDLVLQEAVESKILLIRGNKVMLDADLARLYGVSTKRLNEQVRRNIGRFPDDFMFQLSAEEGESLRSQIATLNTNGSKRGKHRKYLPYVFTEQGLAMLSSVLSSERAIQVNIAIMRAFVKLRRFLMTHKEFAEKLSKHEDKLKKHDEDILVIFEAIRQLMEPPPAKARVITGFKI